MLTLALIKYKLENKKRVKGSKSLGKKDELSKRIMVFWK